MSRILFPAAILALLSLTALASAQGEEFISFTVDGKAIHLSEVKFESHGEGGYIHIEGTKTESVDFGPEARPRHRPMETSVTIEISPEGDSPVGSHQARSSDTMPVYVTWYEVKTTGGRVEVISCQASLDSGDKSDMIFRLTLENYGGPGTLVKGTFSGTLYDEEGKSHRVTDGRLAIRRTEAE